MYRSLDWVQLVKEFQEKEDLILGVKSNEYTADDRDQLLNFREIAIFERQGRRPVDVAWTLFLKHIHAINLAIRTGRYTWEWETVDGEQLKQRFADARNYLLLIAACLDEERNNV